MAKDAKNIKDVKNKKHFFKDFKAELKKVIWPTPFDLLNEQGINRLKSIIKDKVVIENTVENTTENSEENIADVSEIDDESSEENTEQ